jgi:hypothetical protein
MGNRLGFLTACLLIFLASCFLPLPARGQQFQGSITGAVTAPSGSQIPDALSGTHHALSQCTPQDRFPNESGRADNDGAQFGGRSRRVIESGTNQLWLCIFQGEARQ